MPWHCRTHLQPGMVNGRKSILKLKKRWWKLPFCLYSIVVAKGLGNCDSYMYARVDFIHWGATAKNTRLIFRFSLFCFCYCVLKIAILLTGGRQTPDGGSLQEAVRPINNLNVTSYVVPVGTQTDVPVARSDDVMPVTSFDDLPKNAQRIARSIATPRGTVHKTWVE